VLRTLYDKRGGAEADDLELAQRLVQAMRDEPELVEEVLEGVE